ncbi:MAG: LytTR family DNA-binding domain-containing protein [Saprospiraceae bacterium]
MIKTIIVDDEPLALDILEAFVSKMPNLQLVAKCENAFEANEVLQNQKVDLMFLDIQMPQLNGVDFVKSLANPPCVVFTTAYPEFAVEGFELNAVDYLVKPVSMERFMKAVNKVAEKVAAKQEVEEPASTDQFFFVKADKKLVKINFDDIVYIEGLKDYVIIKNETNRVITLQTMKSLEDKLPPQTFRRIHRSFIVNMNKIQALDGSVVEVMEKGQVKHLPIGKNYRDELLELINGRKI